MPDFAFQVLGSEPIHDAATPAVGLRVRVTSRPAREAIQSIALRCQIQIEAPRRRYTAEEEIRLQDLFGEPSRWGQTLRPLLWGHVAATVQAFEESAEFTLSVPCTFDFHATATQYFYGVEGGTVPITLLFSGTAFYLTPSNQLQIAPISWNSEARFPFPVDHWKRSIDMHYPNTAWLSLRRDTFERLNAFKVKHGLASFDEALESLLEAPALRVGA